MSATVVVVLPGYQAGVDESGVEHSHQKLDDAAVRLQKLLVLQQQQQRQNDVETTADDDTADDNYFVVQVQSHPCQDEAATWAYRCRCNFQIVTVGEKENDGMMSSSSSTMYAYAMRTGGRPVTLSADHAFPIATHRIQHAMKSFMRLVLNNRGNNDLSILRQHLTSCTFSSAWRDCCATTDDDTCGTCDETKHIVVDCILTLNYDQPLNDRVARWKDEAQKVCHLMHLQRLNGRSKGLLLSVRSHNDEDANDDEKVDTTTEAGMIRDTLYLNQCQGFHTKKDTWMVSLSKPTKLQNTVSVRYEKPETSFYHPNASAMIKALRWMLDRLQTIQNERPKRLSLLEMYCGCGAHTVALGKSGMLDKILAVDVDPRLVQACKRNVELNKLALLIETRRGDAGDFAREWQRQRKRTNSSGDMNDKDGCYDVLLVDPPRQGLDDQVCQMAMNVTTFQDFLYISCGHEALLRDLKRLSPAYAVVHVAQLDLFPRTNSIETLVHLRRRPAKN